MQPAKGVPNKTDPQVLDQQKDLNFFDFETPDNTEELWIRPTSALTSKILANKLFETTLQKLGKRTKCWITRHYIISDEYLAYQKHSKSTKIKKVMLLSHVKYQAIIPRGKNSSSRRGFRFTKFKSTYELYAPKSDYKRGEKSVHAQIDVILKSKCVNTDFHNQFLIKKLLGKGSFGKVYLAENKLTKENFAVKSFSKTAIEQQKRGKEALFNEIAIMRCLDHKYILKLRAVYESASSLYLVMDLLEGGELFTRLHTKGSYSEYDCMVVFQRIFEAIDYIHKKGFMHRDLKPENILLAKKDDNYDIRIADFGLASVTKASDYLHKRCGTPGYCAPEVLTHKEGELMYNEKCDVFSIGCIFFQLVTGAPPFRSDHYRELLKLNREGEVDFSNPKLFKASREALDLLKKCLAKNISERITAAEALKHAFFTKKNQIKSAELVQEATTVFLPFNITHFSVNHLKKSNLASNDSLKGFHQQASNVFKGVLDTFLDDVSMNGSFDLGQLQSWGLSPRISSFKREDPAGTGVRTRPKISVDTARLCNAGASPRNTHNSSNMQRAAILNAIAKENSPKSGFGKNGDKKYLASGFGEMMQLSLRKSQEKVTIDENLSDGELKTLDELPEIDQNIQNLSIYPNCNPAGASRKILGLKISSVKHSIS